MAYMGSAELARSLFFWILSFLLFPFQWSFQFFVDFFFVSSTKKFRDTTTSSSPGPRLSYLSIHKVCLDTSGRIVCFVIELLYSD